MCGITGILHFDNERPVDLLRLKRMSDTLLHRGPDAEGFHISRNLGLAHRRLSIIDLASGIQPMFNHDKSIALIFNGEIYNFVELKQELCGLGHSFRSTSDTEVIIKAYEEWGTACQTRFNGMWAFALWDDRRGQLFLSRDRMGEKPLYYAFSDRTFIFGSEIKSLLAYGFKASPDPEMLELFLFLGYIPEPYSFYKGIKKLEAGHFMLLKDGSVTADSYWDLPQLQENNLAKEEKQAVAAFSHLFTDSVRIRMRSDVAYGAFLSGGLDSSSIVSEMSDISSKPVETFTIGFKEREFDERGMAALLAGFCQTNHHEQVVMPDTLDESLESILFHYDEPFADPAAIPTEVLSRHASRNVKMVLTGDGADEVLAGYSSYQSEHIASRYGSLPGFIAHWLPGFVDGSAKLFRGSLRYKINRTSRALRAFNTSFQNRLISKSVKIEPSAMKRLYQNQVFPIEQFVGEALHKCPFKDPFYQLMYYNLKVSLPGQMLVKVDRVSMAHSIETRAPFLDHRIVEHLYGLDKKVKMPGFQSVKNVLRLSMAGKVPDQIRNRKKK